MGTRTLALAVAEVVAGAESSPFRLRVGVPGDENDVLRLLDDAVRWLNSRDISEQWGTEPFSSVPRRVEAARQWVVSGGAVLASRDGEPAGALVLGEAPAYVPAAPEPEVYVVLLVAGRSPAARGAGARLLALGEQVARVLGVRGMRVDCYAGGDQQLVRFYESAGFTRTEPFIVGSWPGQLLERRLGGTVAPYSGGEARSSGARDS